MASKLIALGETIVPTSSPVLQPTPAPVTVPISAPVPAGTLLSGYFNKAAYLDPTCSALRESSTTILNICVRNPDKITSGFYTATSTEYVSKTYTDSACKDNEKILRQTYSSLCTNSFRAYVSGSPYPVSTKPTIYNRSVHPTPYLALTLSSTISATLYHPTTNYYSCLSIRYMSPFLLHLSHSLPPTFFVSLIPTYLIPLTFPILTSSIAQQEIEHSRRHKLHQTSHSLLRLRCRRLSSGN